MRDSYQEVQTDVIYICSHSQNVCSFAILKFYIYTHQSYCILLVITTGVAVDEIQDGALSSR
jgi:hypothetical protein